VSLRRCGGRGRCPRRGEGRRAGWRLRVRQAWVVGDGSRGEGVRAAAAVAVARRVGVTVLAAARGPERASPSPCWYASGPCTRRRKVS
jgi:hypothetical protein